MNWESFDYRGYAIAYVHTWPGQVVNRGGYKHGKARRLRAKARYSK